MCSAMCKYTVMYNLNTTVLIIIIKCDIIKG